MIETAPALRLRWYQQAFIGILAVGLVGPLAWWALDPIEPVILGEATVVPMDAATGGRVMTYYDLTVTRADCYYVVDRAVTDSARVVWPATSIIVPAFPTGNQQLGLTMSIPSDASEGNAKITNGIAWICNPWQFFVHPSRPLPPLTVAVDRP